MATVFMAAASLKIEAATTLVDSHTEAGWTTRLSLIVAGNTSLVLLLGLLVGESTGVLGTSPLRYWSATIPIIVFLGSSFAVLTQLCLREREYGQIASRAVYQSYGTFGAQIGLGFIWAGPAGLILGQVFGRAIGIASLARRNKAWQGRPPAGTYGRILKRYWRFPVVFATSAFLNALGLMAPLLFVAWHFGPGSAGQLAMAQRVMLAPVALCASAVAPVFAAELTSRIRRKQVIRHVYVKVSGVLAPLGLAVGLLAAFVVPHVLPGLLGPRWGEVGPFVTIMSATIALQLVASPLSYVFLALEKTKLSIALDLGRFGTLLGAIVATIHFEWNIQSSVLWMYSGLAAIYLTTWAFGLHAVRTHDIDTQRLNEGPAKL